MGIKIVSLILQVISELGISDGNLSTRNPFRIQKIIKSMQELHQSLENNRNMREAKKFSLEFKVNALQQLILQRFQALTIISSIGFAVAGIIISVRGDLIQNEKLAFFSAGLFVVIALISLGRHLYLIRSDVKGIAQKIKDLPGADWDKPLEEKEFKADWWPETLYGFLVIGILFFGLSFCI